MDELDRDVACVRPRSRRAAERDQPTPASEPLGHQMAYACQPVGRLLEESSVALRPLRKQRGDAQRPLAPAGARSRDPQQPVAPRIDALARPRAQHDPLDVGMHDVDVVEELVEVEVEVRKQVDLVDDHELAGPEHQRVLERLVLALGHRAHHHARVLADPELGRANEVADVLDQQQVDLVERQRGDRRAHHIRVEMALAAEAGAGVQLSHGDVQRGQSVGIHRALDVTFEHADAHAGQVRHDALEQRRLAGAGRAHEVDDLDPGPVEVRPVGARDRVVGVERVLDDPHLCPMHCASSTSIASTSNSSPLAISTSLPAHEGQRNAGISISHS